MDVSLIRAGLTLLGSAPMSLFLILLGLAAYRKVKEHHYRSRKKKTETLNGLISYFDRPPKEQSILFREMIFEDHFGYRLSWEEIKFFYNRENAFEKLYKYLAAKRYVKACRKRNMILVREGVDLKRKKWHRRLAIFLVVLYFLEC